MKVAAVVPAYNEAKTVGSIVRALKEARYVDEVIVVSDGSTDDTADEAKLAGADMVRINKSSLGKAQAMDKGVRETDAHIILFVDADLVGFTAAHADMLVAPVKNKKAHMCIGLRDRSWLYRRIGHKLPLISGERAIRREVFTRLKHSLKKGFMIEVAMNFHCRKYRLAVTTAAMEGVSMVKKFEKINAAQAAWSYIKMDLQILWAYISIPFRI